MTIIVTDSTAYLTRSETTILGVRVVNMSYSLDGRSLYTEGCVEENGACEQTVSRYMGRLRTSQAGFSAFMSVFDDLIRAGHDVLCLTISSRLSGTYGNARMAARETAQDRIEVVDSLTTGGGLYLLIREARRLLDSGLDIRQAARELRQVRGRVKTVFSVEDLAALRRSGRLGNVRMSVATILNIKPMLKCLDGGIVSCGITRGRHEQLSTLIRMMGAFQGLVVVQSFHAPASVRFLTQRLLQKGCRTVERRVGPVLGIHLGVGSIGLAWMEGVEGDNTHYGGGRPDRSAENSRHA